MSRYIDADAIKLEKGFFEKVDNVPKFYEWLGKQPTVDAVTVVRCKDCYYYQPENENTEAFCKITKLGCGEDFFCGNMDRKENG